MRLIYNESDEERKLSFDMILYDFSLENEKRPDFIMSLIDEKKIAYEKIDFFTDPIYLNGHSHAGSSCGRYCTAGMNVISSLSYTILHELGHSLGAEHTNEDCVIQQSIIHGRNKYNWCEKNKAIIKRKLSELK